MRTLQYEMTTISVRTRLLPRFENNPQSSIRKQRFPVALGSVNGRKIISAINGFRPSIGSNDGGPTESARLLLERLFARTQMLEKKISKDFGQYHDFGLTINLEVLESDLNDALLNLKKKEEDLQLAERRLVLDRAELNHAKRDLEHREESIAAAHARQKEIEREIKKDKEYLSSHYDQVEKLSLLVKEQEEKIMDVQSTLSLREDQLSELENELMLKTEQVMKMETEVRSRNQLLDEVNRVVKDQNTEIEELHAEIGEKEENLSKLMQMKKTEEERIHMTEAKLEKQAREWLAVKDELKKLSEQASGKIGDIKEAAEDFKRVRALLSDVKSELVAFQKSLASSRSKMEHQATQMGMQLEELKNQKVLVASYAKALEDAQIEVAAEKTKLDVVQAKKNELELQLSAKKELAEHLQEELKKEKSSLKLAKEEINLLRKELHVKEVELCNAQSLLQAKEAELHEARREIQHLKSENACLQLILEEKDQEVLNSHELLTAVNQEVLELEALMKSKEHLIQSTGQKQEGGASALPLELDNTRHKFSEASTTIERIAQLTSKLVVINEDKDALSNHLNALLEIEGISPEEQKQLKSDLQRTKVLLKTKEMEFDDARSALNMKDEELKTVVERLDRKEKEMEKMNEVLNNPDAANKLYAVKVEVEAAVSALSKLVDMSSKILTQSQARTSSKPDLTSVRSSSSVIRIDGVDVSIEQAEREVAHLLALTERLVKDAHISNNGSANL